MTSDAFRHHRRGRVVRRHRGSGWCAANKHTPRDIIAACERAEADLYGFDDLGLQAVTRRNARTLAALLEYNGVRVADAARLIGIDRHAAWYLRTKWSAVDPLHRDEWFTRVEAELAAPPVAE